MNFKKIPVGENPPHDINVIIEIPTHTGPVKYELDKEKQLLVVDRLMSTPMYYPCNYGFIPHTLSDDGDPADVLVISPELISGSLIRCRPIGMLNMTDESGEDAKILAVPIKKITSEYDHIQSYKDVSDALLNKIEHFFAHYKDLEEGKWVKLDDWSDKETAEQEIMASIERQKNNVNEPVPSV